LQSLEAYERFWQESSLSIHDPYFSEQREVMQNMKAFVLKHQNCFERSLACGHLTGSAFVVSEDFHYVLLTFHAKLKKWIQLGGHADGHPYLHDVALREAQEESGVEQFIFFPLLMENQNPIPFDLDIHLIPDSPKEKSHFHYDVRYLLITQKKIPLVITKESLDLKWIALDEVCFYTDEYSVIRQVNKLKMIKNYI